MTIPLLFYLNFFSPNIFFADITKNAILGLLNKDRVAAGFEPLRENPVLEKAAYFKAQDMLEKDYFGHWSPQGISPWHWLNFAGYKYGSAGENLAIGFLDPEELYLAWSESPSHQANMLNQNFQETGIAVLKGDFGGNEVTIVVNFFANPVRQAWGSFNTKATDRKKEINEFTAGNLEPAAGAETVLAENEEFKKESNNEFANKENQPASFKFMNFISRNYYSAVQTATYVFLIFVILALLLNIFAAIRIQHFDLIMKTLGFTLLLAVFYAIDKITLINLIPHNLRIN